MIQSIDFTILDFIQNHLRCHALDSFFKTITSLGNGGFIWIAIAIILLCTKKNKKLGFQMLVALALGYLFGNLLVKNLVARERPFLSNSLIELIIKEPREFSFPSGHALSSFSASFTIFMYNKKYGLLAIILAAGIAFSRLYLYVHYPSDVLGALVLALFVSYLAKYLIQYVSREERI